MITKSYLTQISAGTYEYEILVNSPLYLSSMEGYSPDYFGEDADDLLSEDSFRLILMTKVKNPSITISD